MSHSVQGQLYTGTLTPYIGEIIGAFDSEHFLVAPASGDTTLLLVSTHGDDPVVIDSYDYGSSYRYNTIGEYVYGQKGPVLGVALMKRPAPPVGDAKLAICRLGGTDPYNRTLQVTLVDTFIGTPSMVTHLTSARDKFVVQFSQLGPGDGWNSTGYAQFDLDGNHEWTWLTVWNPDRVRVPRADRLAIWDVYTNEVTLYDSTGTDLDVIASPTPSMTWPETVTLENGRILFLWLAGTRLYYAMLDASTDTLSWSATRSFPTGFASNNGITASAWGNQVVIADYLGSDVSSQTHWLDPYTGARASRTYTQSGHAILAVGYARTVQLASASRYDLLKYLSTPEPALSPVPPAQQDIVWTGDMPGWDHLWFSVRPVFSGTLTDDYYTTVGYEITWPGPGVPAETDGNTVMYLWQSTPTGPVLLDSQVLYAGTPNYETFGYNDQGFVVYGRGSMLYLVGLGNNVLDITAVDTGITDIHCETVRVSQDGLQMMALSYPLDQSYVNWNFFDASGAWVATSPALADPVVAYPAEDRLVINYFDIQISLVTQDGVYLDTVDLPANMQPPKALGCGGFGVALVSNGYYDGPAGEIMYVKYDCSGDALTPYTDWQTLATDWYSDPDWAFWTVLPNASSWMGQLAILPFSYSTPV